MEQETVITQENQEGNVLPADELKRLTDFFQLLIQIDQRERKKQCQK